MKTFMLLATLLLATVAFAQKKPVPQINNAILRLYGMPYVIDGDTIDIEGTRIRLHGIDAPELNQTCSDGFGGKDAAEHLRSLIAQQPVRCERHDIDRYGRIVAICFNAIGDDLNELMVRDGYAYAYAVYSQKYLRAEQVARAAKLGVFSLGRKCELPWLWRKKRRTNDE